MGNDTIFSGPYTVLSTDTKTLILNNPSYVNNFQGSMQGRINSSGQNIITSFKYGYTTAVLNTQI